MTEGPSSAQKQAARPRPEERRARASRALPVALPCPALPPCRCRHDKCLPCEMVLCGIPSDHQCPSPLSVSCRARAWEPPADPLTRAVSTREARLLLHQQRRVHGCGSGAAGLCRVRCACVGSARACARPRAYPRPQPAAATHRHAARTARTVSECTLSRPAAAGAYAFEGNSAAAPPLPPQQPESALPSGPNKGSARCRARCRTLPAIASTDTLQYKATGTGIAKASQGWAGWIQAWRDGCWTFEQLFVFPDETGKAIAGGREGAAGPLRPAAAGARA
jgi:hypothetical protein